MKKIVLGLIGATALVGSTLAVAGGADEAAPLYGAKTGFYLNGNLGYGSAKYKVDEDMGLDTDTKEKGYNGLAWSVAAGYQFYKYLAVEAGYVGLPAHKLKGDTKDDNLTFDSGYYNLLAKVIYPIQQFDVFAKAGVALSRQTVTGKYNDNNNVTLVRSHNYFMPVIGAGADYNITDHIAAGVQALYTIKTDNVASSFAGLAGLTYKF